MKKEKPKKKKLESIPQLIAKAQEVFNAYIRRRDSDGGYFTCISCGKTLPVRNMNAGHYVSVRGCAYLRLHEWNVNGECQYCNGFDEFHLIGYRKNLIEKIGVAAVEWLEVNRNSIKKWTRAELIEFIQKHGHTQA